MSNLTVENVYTRQEAKELTRKHFWKLLGMMLTVFGIVYAAMAAGFALLALGTGISLNAMENTMTTDSSPLFLIGYVAVMMVTGLLSGGLGLGMVSAMIDLCRGDETVKVSRVFSRMSQCLKAFGLGMWVSFKTMLWALPGYAVVLVSAIGLMASIDATSAAEMESASATMTLLPFLGMILLFALVFPAVYRYLLSNYILADEPSTGVFDCVKQSKAMMKGHKWQAFKLIVPLILILYAAAFGMTLVMSLITGVLGAAVVDVLGFLLSIALLGLMLYFVVRMMLCYCLFYLNRQAEQNPPAAQPVQAIEPSQAE